jgi:hypothetical protein
MNGAMEAEEQEVDEQEGQAITAMRDALTRTSLRVSQYDDDGIFSDMDSFVKLSQGNTFITEVTFFPYDTDGDDTLWEKVGEGLANFESLKRFIVYQVEGEDMYEQTPRIDFGILGLVLPYLRQNLHFGIRSPSALLLQQEVQALTRAIRRHPTIKEFNTGHNFPVGTFHIILSALATLPSLEGIRLGTNASDGSHFEHPEALKKLLLSPSLRKVYFAAFTFCGAVCRALEEALQGESNIACLIFDNCSFPANAGDRVARALKQNTTLTTVMLGGQFPQAFYDGFAVVLLVNTTLTNLELNILDDESQVALLAPVFLALGMNKAIKSLTMRHYSSSDGPLHLAIRDGLEKNSTLEMLDICTFFAEEFSVSLVSTLISFLRVSTTLKSLRVIFAAFRYSDLRHVATSCLSIATTLRENSSLETLEICTDNGELSIIAPDTFMIALETVQKNTTLKKLCLSPDLASFGNDGMKRVVSLVKKNFVLTELDSKVTGYDETGELHAILRLNQAGRRYLIDNAGSIAKGVEVLIDVRDDLDCLFYHLLENPILCDIEHQYEQPGASRAKGGSHGTKRVRLAH